MLFKKGLINEVGVDIFVMNILEIHAKQSNRQILCTLAPEDTESEQLRIFTLYVNTSFPCHASPDN